MSETKSVRLNKLVKEFNVSIDRIYSFLESKGIEDLKPNTKVSHEIYMELLGEFDSEKKAKLSADLLAKEKELERAEEIIRKQEEEEKIILEKSKQESIVDTTPPEKSKESVSEEKTNQISTNVEKIRGIKDTGEKIDLDKFKPKEVPTDSKKKRKRIIKPKIDPSKFRKAKQNKKNVVEISEEETQKRVRETLAKLQGGGKKSSVKKIEKKKD